MKSGRILASLCLAACVALTACWLVVLARKGQGAYDMRRSVASTGPVHDTPPRAATWRLAIFSDGERRPAALGQEGEIRPGLPGSGWSAVEPGSGVWSLGNRSVLALPPLSPGEADVALELDPYLPPGIPVQRLTISAAGRTLGEWRLDAAGRTTLHFALPQDLPRSGGVELQLSLPDADSPARHVVGATDVRRIGVMLHRITITG